MFSSSSSSTELKHGKRAAGMSVTQRIHLEATEALVDCAASVLCYVQFWETGCHPVEDGGYLGLQKKVVESLL